MKTTTFRQTLEEQIERLVRAEMAGIRASVAVAVDRALALDAHGPDRRGARRKTQAKRRTSEQVAALGERLLAAVKATPGQMMTALAPQIGATASELSLPAARLKRAGRLRSAGQRHNTKYFPASESSAARQA